MTENVEPPVQLDIDGEDAQPTEPGPDVKPKAVKPKRPTTRAGRAAKAAERARKSAASGKPPAEKKPAQGRGPRTSPLQSRLNGAIVGVGSALTISGAMMGSQPLIADGDVVTTHAPHLADALDKLAKNDPRVAAALERILTAGAYGGLIAAVMPIALGIMANHNMIPAGLAGMAGGGAPAPTSPTGLDDYVFGPPAA